MRKLKGGRLTSVYSVCAYDVLVLLLVAIGAWNAPAAAQTVRTGSIAGTVTDVSGASLPGVTVTLTSPALQTPQLVKTTDDQGQYEFLNLPLGSYRAEFQRSGFSGVAREGIVLTAGFAARIDAGLQVASVQQTVEVTSASPTVDATTNSGGGTLENHVLEQVPNGHTYGDIEAMSPGLKPSSPPQIGQIGFGALSGTYLNYGMSGQERVFMDGVLMESNEAPDFAISDEVDVKTFATNAQSPTAGPQIQMIIKSGGNDFHGRVKEEYINSALDSTNITPLLISQGIKTGNNLLYSTDLMADIGGRIIRDKLWFYTGLRNEENKITVAGYVGEPASSNWETTGKISYQFTPKNLFTGFYNRGIAVQPQSFASRFIPFDTTETLHYYNYRAKTEWQGTLTPHLIADVMVGDSWYVAIYTTPAEATLLPSTLDLTTQLQSGASFDSRANITRPTDYEQLNGSLSYLPDGHFLGTHQIVVGANFWKEEVKAKSPAMPSGDYQMVFKTVGSLAHQPFELNANNRPSINANVLDYDAAFITDVWKVSRRLTMNVGLRFEHNHADDPGEFKPQGPFGVSATYAEVNGGTWNNWAPRAGFAYDLTGNGKTAVKGSYGLYNQDFGQGFASVYNLNTVTTTTYLWHDLNHDNLYEPGEVNLSTSSTDFVGVSGTTNPVFNPNLKQAKTHEVTGDVERELPGGISVRGLWVYMLQVDLYGNVNPLRPFSAYSIPVQVTDPGPTGVAGGPGSGTVYTLYDYAPAYKGGAFVGIEPENRPGGRNDYSNSFEGRVRKAQGKWYLESSFLETHFHRYVVGVPQSPNDINLFPLDTTWQWEFKAIGRYQAPFGISISALYNALSGAPGQATYIYAGLPQSVTLTEPVGAYGAVLGPSRKNMNLGIAKTIALKSDRYHLLLTVDCLNLFNTSVPWVQTWAEGPVYGFPTTIATPRALRWGAGFTF